jgi:ribose 1,5-bisphosphate isomerase
MEEQVIKLIDAIRMDRSRGAAELARLAAEALVAVGDAKLPLSSGAYVESVYAAARRIANARPNMAPLQHAVAAVLTALDSANKRLLAPQDIHSIVAEAAKAFQDASRAASSAVASLAQTLVEPGETILTHSRSSTVLKALAGMAAKKINVVVTESRPLNEGVGVACELDRFGIDVTLITDAQVGVMMPRIKRVFVGADSILADGSLVNKAGSYPIALAARDCNVPFSVLCETTKINPFALPGRISLEENDPAEVLETDEPFRVRNVYFDITPLSLISNLVTESGIHNPGGFLPLFRDFKDRLLPVLQLLNTDED